MNPTPNHQRKLSDLNAAWQWQQVRFILEAALEVKPESRNELVREACRGDKDLAEEVRALLALEPQIESFIEARPAELGRDDEQPLPTGYRLGVYQIDRMIARGGMGVVYLGRREDCSFSRDVAIKCLYRAEADELVDWFHNERRILETLDHPNIVKSLDAGTSEAGDLYLVMEYVDGRRIDDFCDRSHLSVEERLRLFLRVCSAVEFAHERSIIHQDLKPANILVTAEGEPKLLDFGIAKLLGPQGECPKKPRLFHPLTPAYASPEQIGGESATVTSDVYALGVLLYELLTGRPPSAAIMKSSAKLVRLLDQRRPEPPSDIVVKACSGRGQSKGSFSPDEIAYLRGCSPDELKWKLRGELDVIVLKALHSDPCERYHSVGQLSEALERFLEAIEGSWQEFPETAAVALSQAQRSTDRWFGELLFVILAVALLIVLPMSTTTQQLERAFDPATAGVEAVIYISDVANVPTISITMRSKFPLVKKVGGGPSAPEMQILVKKP